MTNKVLINSTQNLDAISRTYDSNLASSGGSTILKINGN